MNTTAARVKELIDQAGETQNDFAKRISLDPSKLSRSLSGQRRFSLANLSAIADACEVSVDWLAGGEARTTVAARRDSAAPIDTARKDAEKIAMQRADLATLGIKTRGKLPNSLPQRTGLEIEQGASLAEAALAHLSADGFEIVGSTNEQLISAIEARFGIDIVVLDGNRGIDGLAIALPDARVIVLSTTTMPARQRFTLAHELCHLLTGDDQDVHLDTNVYEASAPGERRANAFAAAFTMPASFVKAETERCQGDITTEVFDFMVSRLHVSPAAFAYRLSNLGLVNAEQAATWKKTTYQEVLSRSGKSADFASEQAASTIRRLPAKLLEDTFTAYQQGLTTLRPYANLLQKDVNELRDVLSSAVA